MAKAGVFINVVGDADLAAFDRAQRELDAMRRKVEGASKGMSDGFAKAGAGMVAAGGKMSSVGGTLSRNLSLPLALVGAGAVKTQADFEQAMNQLQVAADVPAEGMADLEALAKRMGAETVFSAGEAANAMVELAKAGMTPAQIEAGALEASMALAATEGLNLADAATTVVNAMGAFHIAAKDTSAVADALAGASMASTASVDSLRMALSQVGTGAHAAGLSLNDTVAVLAAFDQAGIKGSDAGTSLKTMLSRLVPNTAKAAEAMQELGLNFVDAHGNFLPIEKVAGQLQAKLGKLSEAERTVALNTIFGSDAQRAANILTEQGEAGIAKLIKATEKQGSAQKMADARMKGTAGSLEKMKGSIETAGLAIGQSLAPYVVQVADKIAELANRFTSLDPATQKTVVAIAAIALAIGPVTKGLGLLVTGVGRFVQAIGFVIKIMNVLRLAFMANPWMLLIAAVVLIAVIIYKNWDKIKAFLLKAWEVIKSAAAATWNWIKNVTLSVWNAIKGFFIQVFNVLKTIFLNFTGPGLIIKHWNTIKAVTLAVWNAIVGAIRVAINAVRTVITTALGIVRGIWQSVWGVIGGLVKAVWNLIVAVVRLGAKLVMFGIRTYLKAAQALWSTIWRAIVAVAQAVWNTIVKVVKTYINIVRTVISTVMGAIRKVISTIMNAIRAVIAAVWGAIGSKVMAVVNGIRNTVTSAFNKVRSIVTSVVNTVRSTVTSGFNTAKTAATTAFNGLRDAVGRAIQQALDKVRGIIDKVKGVFSGAATWLRDAGARIIQGLIDGITSKINALTSKLNKITDMIPEVKGPPAKDAKLLRGNGQLIMDGLIGGIASQVPSLVRGLRGVTNTIAGTNMPGLVAGAFGAGPLAGKAAGAGVGGVYIAPGAVTVSVGAGAGVTPGDVRAIVHEGFVELAREIAQR